MGNSQKLKKMLQQNYSGPFSHPDYELGHIQIYKHKQIEKFYGKTTIYLIQKLKQKQKIIEIRTKIRNQNLVQSKYEQDNNNCCSSGKTLTYYFQYYYFNLQNEIQVRKQKKVKFEPEEIRRSLIQILRGVKPLHQSGLTHQNIRPRNILITQEGNLKVLDPKIFTCNSSLDHYKQNLKKGYLSPSQIRNLNQNIHQLDNKMKSDIYSIGMLGLQMVTLQPQQNRYQNRDGIWVLEKQQQTENICNQLVGRQLANAFRILLSQRQQQRPTAYQAIKILESVRLDEFENRTQENSKQQINKSYYNYPSQNILLQNKNKLTQSKSRLEPNSSLNLKTETVPDTNLQNYRLRALPLNKVLKNQLSFNTPINNTYNPEFLIQPPAPSSYNPNKQSPQPLNRKNVQSPAIFVKKSEQKLRPYSAINQRQPSMRINSSMNRLRFDDRPNKLIELRSIRKEQLIPLIKVEQLRPKMVLSPANQSRIYFGSNLNNKKIYQKDFENKSQRFYSGIGSYQYVPKLQSLQIQQSKTNPHYLIQQQRRKKQIFQAQQQRRRKYNLAYQQKSRQQEYQQQRRRRKQYQAQQQRRKRQEQQVQKQIRRRLQQQYTQKLYQYQTQLYNRNIYQAQQQKRRKQMNILEMQQINRKMLQQEKKQRKKQNRLNFQQSIPTYFNKIEDNSLSDNITNHLQINRIDRLRNNQEVNNEEYQQLLNNKNNSQQNADKNQKVSIQNFYYIADQDQINTKMQYQKEPIRSKKYKKTGFIKSISTQEDQEQDDYRPKRLTLLINQVNRTPTNPIVEEPKEQNNKCIDIPNEENIGKTQQKKNIVVKKQKKKRTLNPYAYQKRATFANRQNN